MNTIAGFITDYDKYGRLTLEYPAARSGTDTLNTERQLRAFDKGRLGWSPLQYRTFLAKPDKRTCFAYDAKGVRITDFSKTVAHSAQLEAEFLPFAGDGRGWFIRVLSIKLTD